MTLRSTGKGLLLVLLSTLVWIVLLAPARVVMHVLPAKLPVALQGISGTLWSGNVAQAALVQNGQVLAQGRLAWQLRPLSLLRLAPCIEFSVMDTGVASSTVSGVVAGSACVSISGDIALHEVNFDLPAGYFLRSADLRLGGEISGRVNTLIWGSDRLAALDGQGLWSDARIASNEVNVSLQTLPFTVRRETDDSVMLQVGNADLLVRQTDTPLHVALQSTVGLDGRFYTQAELTVQSQTPDSVVELLDLLAEPKGAGLYTLEVRSQR